MPPVAAVLSPLCSLPMFVACSLLCTALSSCPLAFMYSAPRVPFAVCPFALRFSSTLLRLVSFLSKLTRNGGLLAPCKGITAPEASAPEAALRRDPWVGTCPASASVHKVSSTFQMAIKRRSFSFTRDSRVLGCLVFRAMDFTKPTKSSSA